MPRPGQIGVTLQERVIALADKHWGESSPHGYNTRADFIHEAIRMHVRWLEQRGPDRLVTRAELHSTLLACFAAYEGGGMDRLRTLLELDSLMD